jgi:hypothetical protein
MFLILFYQAIPSKMLIFEPLNRFEKSNFGDLIISLFPIKIKQQFRGQTTEILK